VKQGLSVAERFWPKVATTDNNEDACWPWKASLRSSGYGQFYFRGRPTNASRVAYELAYGPVPAGMDVCHRCDNPPCVRPSHLFIGTRRENMFDAKRKGRLRAPRGEANPKAKITAVQVAAIRAEYAAGGATHRSLGAKYGLNHSTVGDILRGQCWTEARSA